MRLGWLVRPDRAGPRGHGLESQYDEQWGAIGEHWAGESQGWICILKTQPSCRSAPGQGPLAYGASLPPIPAWQSSQTSFLEPTSQVDPHHHHYMGSWLYLLPEHLPQTPPQSAWDPLHWLLPDHQAWPTPGAYQQPPMERLACDRRKRHTHLLADRGGEEGSRWEEVCSFKAGTRGHSLPGVPVFSESQAGTRWAWRWEVVSADSGTVTLLEKHERTAGKLKALPWLGSDTSCSLGCFSSAMFT